MSESKTGNTFKKKVDAMMSQREKEAEAEAAKARARDEVNKLELQHQVIEGEIIGHETAKAALDVKIWNARGRMQEIRLKQGRVLGGLRS